jgi:hypothetical protein
LEPVILTQPNIPKPLHGVNPRAIKGKVWWDAKRKEAYKSTNYHCLACGVEKAKAKGKQWLEAHEFWNINYTTGICTMTKIVPLCHYCHNFIHSGRLYLCKSHEEIIDILEHGFQILKNNKLKCFFGTSEIAKRCGARTFGVKPEKVKRCNVRWEAWRVILEGEEYYSTFRDEQEWADHWEELNER